MGVESCMKSNVAFIPISATVLQAAELMVSRHVNVLPVVDGTKHPVGILQMRDLLSLALPDFFGLLPGSDFAHDFGAVESSLPSPDLLAQNVGSLMEPAITIESSCGLLRAYTLMLQKELNDLPVVDGAGMLVGIVSRTDVGSAVLNSWGLENRSHS